MMKMNPGVRRTAIVAMIFVVFIGVSLLVARFTGDRPSPEQACTQKCASLNKQGHLVYRGPDTPKSFYKEANSVCECQ